MAKISIIVITFNGMEFIEDCLRTAEQSIEQSDAEILVVDNGSVDGTPDFVRNHHPRAVLLCNQNNTGFAPAANQGLREAKGEILFLLNQDTRLRDGAVASLAERLTKDKQIGVIGPKFVGFDGRMQRSCRAFPKYRDLLFEFTGLSYLFSDSKIFSRWKMGWFDHEHERAVDQPMGAAMMFRKDVLDKIGYLDESFGLFFNDVDFCRRVKEAGYINLYYPSAVVEHYVGGSTRLNKPKAIIESHQSMYKYFKKYNHEIIQRPLLYFWGAVLYMSAYLRAGFWVIFKS